MKALLRRRGQLELVEVAAPRAVRRHEVRLRVLVAGVCRTDVYAARGQLTVREPVILGHEFVAEVLEVGAGVTGLELGTRVVVCPVLVCGQCAGCVATSGERRVDRCLERRFLGLDVDGCFAEQVVVPASAVQPVPAGLSERAAAFVEPVAAALAVLEAGLVRGSRGLLVGSGRISVLSERVLALGGFGHVEVMSPERAEEVAANRYDFAVEAVATSATLGMCLRALRPGGLLVMKSRTPSPLTLDPRVVVQKQLTLRGAEYGSFSEALRVLAEERLRVADLLGPEAELGEFEQVFEAALDERAGKRFFRIAAARAGAARGGS